MAAASNSLFPIFEQATGTCIIGLQNIPQAKRCKVDCKWGCLIFKDLDNDQEDPMFRTLQNAQELPPTDQFRLDLRTVEGVIDMQFEPADFRNIRSAACGPVLGEEVGACWDWRLNSFFVILKKLGAGGMGTVYLARRIGDDDGTLYAIKTTRKSIKDTREIDLMFTARHPHLMSAIECLVERAEYHIVMPLMNMDDLSKVVRNFPGPVDEVNLKRMMRQMLLGLKGLHDRGYVHKDIKPENFFVNCENSQFVLKLGDFGLARHIGNSTLEEVNGTLAYFAPEIVLQRPYGMLVDVWALGCTFYEIMTKTQLFDNSRNLRDVEICFKIVRGYVKGSREWNRVQNATNGALKNNLLGLMLDRNPSTRSSVDDLLRHPYLQ